MRFLGSTKSKNDTTDFLKNLKDQINDFVQYQVFKCNADSMLYIIHSPLKLKQYTIYWEFLVLGKFLRKMPIGKCVKFSLSLIFTSKTPNEDVKQGLIFAVSIFGNFREAMNTAKIKPTPKIPGVRYC